MTRLVNWGPDPGKSFVFRDPPEIHKAKHAAIKVALRPSFSCVVVGSYFILVGGRGEQELEHIIGVPEELTRLYATP